MVESDIYENLLKPISVRMSASSKRTLSGRCSTKSMPHFRTLKSRRVLGRDLKGIIGFQWVQVSHFVFWLIVIAAWSYVGFHVQSKWAPRNHRKEAFVGYKSETDSVYWHLDVGNDAPPLGFNTGSFSVMQHMPVPEAKDSNLKKLSYAILAREERDAQSDKNAVKRKMKVPERKLRKKVGMRGETIVVQIGAEGTEEEWVPRKNTSHGLLVGPFGKIEDAILGWNANKRRWTCDTKGDFAKAVWSRSFVLVFHELSMTGAPLSMMELATEILNCGGTVSAVVLIRKGGLMTELEKRGIKVLKEKSEVSFKAAFKADLVISGSAVCSSWIEQYLMHFPAGSNRIVWWIMENRREYFDRAKNLLSRVKMLTFLSESQREQWLAWCAEEQIHLNTEPMLVPLSVNDELAFLAGFPCFLNTPEFSVEKMLEKRKLLRRAVRKEMGLDDNIVLVMALSSINAGKGQRLLLEAALLVAEHKVSFEDSKRNVLLEGKMFPLVSPTNQTATDSSTSSTIFHHTVRSSNENINSGTKNNIPYAAGKQSIEESEMADMLSRQKQLTAGTGKLGKIKDLLIEKDVRKEQDLKVLIGSVGSKSNKAVYIKEILQLMSRHPNSSKLVLWTPATTRVALLYSAADVYVINSQGIGETFGRVTIEAMAFGLPVLGTDAGGTKEIILHNITGLLHPVGRQGTRTLAENMLYLVSNPSAREMMGERGRQRVQDRYLKDHTYLKFAAVLTNCIRTK